MFNLGIPRAWRWGLSILEFPKVRFKGGGGGGGVKAKY